MRCDARSRRNLAPCTGVADTCFSLQFSPSPHVTVLSPGAFTTSRASRQVLLPRHVTLQFVAAVHFTPSRHSPDGPSAAPHATLQSPCAEVQLTPPPVAHASLPMQRMPQWTEPVQATPALQLLSPVQPTSHVRPAHVTLPASQALAPTQSSVQRSVAVQAIPALHAELPLHVTSQVLPPQRTPLPFMQASEPSHLILQEVASRQSTPSLHAEAPTHETSHATPAGHLTAAFGFPTMTHVLSLHV